MSGSVDLIIETATDWGIQVEWTDSNNDPYPFSAPTMQMRQELSSTGTLIARLDETNQWDGLLTIVSPGVVQARMTGAQTNKLKTGYGFWDLYVMLYGNRVRLVFGTVAIAAHVTELADV